MKEIEPPEPVRRYERDKLGDKFHIDIKKLARFERIGRRITSDRTGRSNSRDIERFIQTALKEQAYAVRDATSRRRAAELSVWLHH